MGVYTERATNEDQSISLLSLLTKIDGYHFSSADTSSVLYSYIESLIFVERQLFECDRPQMMFYRFTDADSSHSSWQRSTITRAHLWEDWYCACLVPTAHGQASFHAFRIDGIKHKDYDDTVGNADDALKGTRLWVGGAISGIDSAVKHVPLAIWNTRNAPLLRQEVDDALLLIGKAVSDPGYSLLALHPITGEIFWSYPLPERGEPTIATLVVAHDLVYLQGEDSIAAIDTQTHLPRWTWQASTSLLHAFYANALLFVIAERGQITALDAKTGEPCWTWKMEGEMLQKWQSLDQETRFKQAAFSTIADGTLLGVVGDTLYALR